MGVNKLLIWLKDKSFLIALIFGLISSLVLLIVKFQASISYHPDISGSEGSVIVPIQLLVSGNPIYLDPESAPFRLSQYAPLYSTIIATFCKIVGWSAIEVHKIYLASRLWSNIFTLATACFIGAFLYRVTKKPITAALAGLFVFHVLSFWLLTTSRPDSLLILLTSLFVFSAYNALKDDGKQLWWFVAIFIAVSAFFVKQSGAILSISAGAFWILNKQWKTLLTLTFFGIAVFGFYLLILPVNTIELFFTNIVGGVANSASWDWFYDWTLQHWLLQFAPLILVNVIVSAYIIYYRTSPFYLFLTLCCFLFFLFATSTAFKIGAGVGYYQDYLLLAVVQISLFVTDSANARRFDNVFLKAAVPLYLVIAFLHCSLFVFMKYRPVINSNFEAQYIEERKVSEYLYGEKNLKPNEWVYICGGNNLEGYFLNQFLVHNALIPFSDLVYLANLNGTFRFDKFKSMVRRKEIKYVISLKGSVPVNILNVDFANTLKYSSTVGSFDIYEADK
ncbi:glycosyltransferase family 39 protein [Dyadobacter sp. CY326]|uniref:glycosyltransferase family 39 protein n=1 Tax=Dyadobacter sp. CY326 TaxID=2907300 RepID=UPI001F23163A|nr:glycosyltransferase family 39 protein [Dyadobacter sp. CY326]MCE7067261.1 glycosyltransferase family 39 protein [Dyadobacter sp. CY326]